MACFLVLKVVPKESQGKPSLEPPKGMSTVTILQCLAKYAEQMGAFNLARFVYVSLFPPLHTKAVSLSTRVR